MTPHTYSAYGLRVDSAFPLPELRPSSPKGSAADITIGYGDVPVSLARPAANGIAWQASPGQLLLSVEQVARYLVVEDREIRVQPLFGTSDTDVRLFLLGTVFAAVLHARRMLLLHASGIHTPRGAVLLMGRSGAGKSTLLGAFLQRGYSMLSDDKAGIVRHEDGTVQVMPGIPVIRLTHEAATDLRYPVNGCALNPSSNKYALPVAQFHPQPIPLRAAYSLNVHNQSDISLERLPSLDRFETLNRHTYRRRFLHLEEQRRSHFRLLAAVSSGVPIARVFRPEHPRRIADLATRIEEDLMR